jgi:hypothetical protein
VVGGVATEQHRALIHEKPLASIEYCPTKAQGGQTVGGNMKIFTSLVFLIGLAGSAWASVVPGPEISAGPLGMTLAAGVVYLIKRRGKRS